MKQCYRLMLVVLILGGVGHQTFAESTADRFREGSHYQRIDPPAPAERKPGRIEVVEMFLYACPHCYELDPKIREWLKDKPNVDLHLVPAIVGPSWADQARAFYIAKALGKSDQLHQVLYKAIHEEGLKLYNDLSVLDFFESQGVKRQLAIELYNSQEIADSVNEARVRTVKYGLRGVPAVVVNGKYVTAPYFVRNQEEMIEVLDHLIELEMLQLKTEARLTK